VVEAAALAGVFQQHQLERRVGDREIGVAGPELGRAGAEQLGAELDGLADVVDVEGELHAAQPTISHHLKVLHEVGLLDREKRGVWVYCRARTLALASLGALIGYPRPDRPSAHEPV
jgi:DNA-binding transcriptional ArsR family regulator